MVTSSRLLAPDSLKFWLIVGITSTVILILFTVRALVRKGKSRRSDGSGREDDVEDNHSEMADDQNLVTYVVQMAQPTDLSPAPAPAPAEIRPWPLPQLPSLDDLSLDDFLPR